VTSTVAVRVGTVGELGALVDAALGDVLVTGAAVTGALLGASVVMLVVTLPTEVVTVGSAVEISASKLSLKSEVLVDAVAAGVEV